MKSRYQVMTALIIPLMLLLSISFMSAQPAEAAVVATPASITAPAADADGNYSVSWTGSMTGATYLLQEATNPDFTVGVRTAYSGPALSASITGRLQNRSYYYRVRASYSGYTASAWRTAALAVAVPGTVTCVAPTAITVPKADADGAFSVTWTASTTAGVTYLLQEATNSSFTTGLRTAYSGTALSAAISGRTQNASYFYRVKSVKAGAKDSAWKIAVNAAAVPGTTALSPAAITVPATDADGAFSVTWTASTTAGVSYLLQEATNSSFTTGLRTAYSGTGLSAAITGRIQGSSYFYRVKAVKAGYLDSAWKTAANAAVVGAAACAAPASITVPASDLEGSYTVSWAASTTAGVTYVLQEATNSAFTTGLRTAYTGTALSVNITGKPLKTSYYYRVKATKLNTTDSPWKTSGVVVIGRVLSGNYILLNQSLAFWKDLSGVKQDIEGGRITATFNPTGGCSMTYNGYSFTKDASSENVTVSPYTQSATNCSYAIGADGDLTTSFDTPSGHRTHSGWVSLDGDTMVLGGAKTTGEDYRTSQMVGMRQGVSEGLGTLYGTYTLLQQRSGFEKLLSNSSVNTNAQGLLMTATFNGAGGCTLSYAGNYFEKEGSTASAQPLTGTATGCSYSVTSNGTVSMSFNADGGARTLSGHVSADGDTVLLGGAKQTTTSTGINYDTDQTVGVRRGSYMGASQLKGAYRLVYQEQGFGGSAPSFGALNGVNFNTTFNGAGGCTLSFSGTYFETDSQATIVDTEAEVGTASSCSYTVAADGAVKISVAFPDGSLSLAGNLSADGTMLLVGGSRTPNADFNDYVVYQVPGVKVK